MSPGGPILTSVDSLGPTVRQQIDRPVLALEIDDDGAVTAAPTPGPVIDADDARWWCRLNRNSPDQAEQRVTADRHGEQARHAVTPVHRPRPGPGSAGPRRAGRCAVCDPASPQASARRRSGAGSSTAGSGSGGSEGTGRRCGPSGEGRQQGGCSGREPVPTAWRISDSRRSDRRIGHAR